MNTLLFHSTDRFYTRQGVVITNAFKYFGFISYAHVDESIAARLHGALETYSIPKALKPNRDHTLSPIFRDTTELTAHHSLSEKIRDAVNNSRFLIVLCSPAAQTSHWVNEEIRLFRKLHGGNSILCALVDGTPATSFPPALLEGGREPLAANLSGGRAGFRLGVTQLAASMLGVGLDALIQRETQRRRMRARLLTTGSMVFAALMGGMAWTAVNARDAAEVSRTEAEKMVEFMLTDLKQDLEPVGKLDILDDVGKRVTGYYDAIPLTDMDDDRLARQARARHLLGQVALDQGKMEKAQAEIDAAYQATKEVMRRNPDDTDAIFAHAQSAYWLGYLAKLSEDFLETLILWQEYNDLGYQLYKSAPETLDWVMEAAWGQNSLGGAYSYLGEPETALGHFEKAVVLFSKAKIIAPKDTNIDIEEADVLAGMASEFFKLKQFDSALQSRLTELKILEELTKKTDNIDLQYRLFLTKLNYWEIKNTIGGKCNTESPSEILEQSKKFLKQDPSNYRWKRNYFAYSNDFIIMCHKDFPRNELVNRIDDLLSFAETENIQISNYADGLKTLKRNINPPYQ